MSADEQAEVPSHIDVRAGTDLFLVLGDGEKLKAAREQALLTPIAGAEALTSAE